MLFCAEDNMRKSRMPLFFLNSQIYMVNYQYCYMNNTSISFFCIRSYNYEIHKQNKTVCKLYFQKGVDNVFLKNERVLII